MKFARSVLIAGGIFNSVMGLFFFNNVLLQFFLGLALQAEEAIFRHSAVIPFPQNPVHLLLIHGFGAAALILGAMLIYSARDPLRYLPFVFIDGLGRLLYGSLMVTYVLRYSLMWIMLVFALVELFFALVYLCLSWKLSDR
ncbi:MAG TPA: hypothetical protein VLR94_07485 [Acidobacteriota bacterium]|nr:hypothetical protein [Acidobacteriota bacterium]